MRRLDRDGYGQLLLSWVAGELSGLYRQHVESAAPGTLLIGGAAWGPLYIARWLHLGARTLLSKRNAQALKGRCRILLYTDGAGFDLLWRWAGKMQARGFPTQIVVLPDLLLAQLTKRDDNKYMLLGAVQNLLVQIAARHGMGFHATFPDCIYSEGYFENLMRLAKEHPAICHTGISGTMKVVDEIQPYARGDAYEVPGLELGDIAFRNLHGESLGNLMNRGRELLGFPPSHCTIWQGQDRLSYFCCHTNATYMSPEICLQAPVRFFSPIDCNMPYMLPGGKYYAPTLADDMVQIEAADGSKAGSTLRPDPENFAAICWYFTNFRDEYLPTFERAAEIPIKPQAEYLTADEIAAGHAKTIEVLKTYKETVRGRIAFKEVA